MPPDGPDFWEPAMERDGEHRRLAVKKYTNRRFYDTTRSRHVTLGDMHDLICEGYDLHITGSKTGEDITNVVLTQIILERDPPKLTIFPAETLHQLIRTQQQFVGSVVEQFFARVLESHKTSQEQWSRFLQNTLGIAPMNPANPVEWTRSLMEAVFPVPRPQPEPRRPAADERDREVEELNDRVAELSRLVERLAKERSGD